MPDERDLHDLRNPVYTDDYHTCPECNMRCNCSDQPCTHCVGEIEPLILDEGNPVISPAFKKSHPDMFASNYVLLPKPSYLSKDGSVKPGIQLSGTNEYYAPKSDIP